MTVSGTTTRTSYDGNDSTTEFAYNNYVTDEEELVVIERVVATGVETTKTLTTHYTVAVESDYSGATVTMLTAPATGVKLIIYRDVPLTQLTDLSDNNVENALDKLTAAVQRLDERADRSIELSDGYYGTFDGSLPVVLTAGNAICINDAGTGLALSSSILSDITADESTLTLSGGTEMSILAVGTTQITDSSVTYAKMQDVAAASRILGRGSAGGSGAVQELSVDGTTIEIDSTVLGVVDGGIDTTQLADDAVSLAKMDAGTAGNLITYDASGDPAAVATGTANQVLTSNGAGAAPTFQDLPTIGTPDDDSVDLDQLAHQTRGDLLTFDASGPTDLAIGTAGYVLVSDGTDPSWGTVGTAGLAANAVTYAKMQATSASTKILGRGTSSAGIPQELSLDGTTLTMSGTTISVVADIYAAASHNHDEDYADITDTAAHVAATTGVHGATSAPSANNIVQAKATGKIDSGWLPDLSATYSAVDHDHDEDYAAASHLHTGQYAEYAHTHTGVYSAVGHDHDEDYAPIAAGVTNGDSHDHAGGDGASIDTAALADNAVSLAKLAGGTADTLIGFDAAGDPTEIAAGTNITISGGTIAAAAAGLWSGDAGDTTNGYLYSTDSTFAAVTVRDDNGFSVTNGSGTNYVSLNANGVVNYVSTTYAGALNLSSEAQGDILYHNGTGWTRLAKGTTGQVLTMGASGVPEWATP